MNFDDLQKLYKELVKEDVDISSENVKELTSSLYRSKFILEQEYINGWKLVNEVVEDPELTPIPKNIFINIAKNLCKEYAIVKYSYKELYQNLKEYDFMDKAQKISDKHRNDDVPTLFYPTSGLRYQRTYGEWIDLGFAVDKVFEGLKVKFFQNKKIQIKGLTNEEWENIKKIESYCRER